MPTCLFCRGEHMQEAAQYDGFVEALPSFCCFVAGRACDESYASRLIAIWLRRQVYLTSWINCGEMLDNICCSDGIGQIAQEETIGLLRVDFTRGFRYRIGVW